MKILNKIFVLLLFAALIAGCAPRTSAAPAPAAGSSGAYLSSFGLTQTKPLDIFVYDGGEVEDFEDNRYMDWLFETTGIEIKMTIVPAVAIEERLALSFMSSSLPDVYWGSMLFQKGQLEMYGVEEKLLIPLDDMIASQYGKETKKFLEVTGLTDFICSTDGKIYALPRFSESMHTEHAERALINVEFLEQVGMPMPTTTDNFYDTLKAFKELDPDIIPFSGTFNGWNADIFCWTMEPFVFIDGKPNYKIDYTADGKLFSVLNSDGYREGLRYIHKLMSEGLIYEGSLTIAAAELRAIAENPEKPILGGALAGGPHAFTGPESGRYEHYRCMPALIGPTGLQQTPWFRYNTVQAGRFAITSSCSQPEIAMVWGDIMYTLDSSLRNRMGVFGEDWRDAEPGELTYNGGQADWTRINTYSGQSQSQHLGNNGIWYETNDTYLFRWAMPVGTNIRDFEQNQLAMAVDVVEMGYIPIRKEIVDRAMIVLNADDAMDLAMVWDEIKLYSEESRAGFALGTLSLDNDWDDYVSQLDNLGLPKLIELLQKGYDASLVKVGAGGLK